MKKYPKPTDLFLEMLYIRLHDTLVKRSDHNIPIVLNIQIKQHITVMTMKMVQEEIKLQMKDE